MVVPMKPAVIMENVGLGVELWRVNGAIPQIQAGMVVHKHIAQMIGIVTNAGNALPLVVGNKGSGKTGKFPDSSKRKLLRNETSSSLIKRI